MQVTYTIYTQRITPESAEMGDFDGPPEIEESDTDTLLAVLRRAVNTYGICPRTDDDSPTWFSADSPPEDREFFEQGVEKIRTMNIHSLTARQGRRVNAILKRLWGR